MVKKRNRPTVEGDIRRLAVMADHDRMSRRLNAEVIHELFAVGLKLQALASQFNDVTIKRQLDEAVSSTDQAIYAVRDMVFETQPWDGSLERMMVQQRRGSPAG